MAEYGGCVCVSLLQCMLVLTKEAAGSGASSGAWTLHGQLDNLLFVSGLLHPSDSSNGKLSFSCDLHCGCNFWDFKYIQLS